MELHANLLDASSSSSGLMKYPLDNGDSIVHIPDTSENVQNDSARSSTVKLHVWRRLKLLARFIPFFPGIVFLALLSIVESVIVAKVGVVAGSFYKIVVDGIPSALVSMLLHSATLYLACVAVSAASSWLSGYLSVRWRRSIASILHTLYYRKTTFSRLPDTIDNVDQRITSECGMLTEYLASTARLATGAPFRVIFYSYLAFKFVAWRGVAAIAAFFLASAALQRLVSLPFTRSMFSQEKYEGNLRSSALRVRENASDIASYRGGDAERLYAEDVLGATLRNQFEVVLWQGILAASTRFVDYSGAILNYILVASIVFASSESRSGGKTAEFVSNASFYTLALTYSYTELLDLAASLSKVGTYAARVGELLEYLDPDSTVCLRKESTVAEILHNFGGRILQRASLWHRIHSDGEGECRRQSLDEREMNQSEFGNILLHPTKFLFADDILMEISVHEISSDLVKEVETVFPELAQNSLAGTVNRYQSTSGNILCCLSFQFAGNGNIDLKNGSNPFEYARKGSKHGLVDTSDDSNVNQLTEELLKPLISSQEGLIDPEASIEMDRLLHNFLTWFNLLSKELNGEDSKYWCNAVDPRTGMALNGLQGEKWSEVAASHVLLKYEKITDGLCPLVVHPTYGTSAYPASVFTNAPFDVLLKSLNRLAASREATRVSFDGSLMPESNHSIGQDAQSFLKVHNLTLKTPDNQILIENLRFDAKLGKHILICGPNGCGKSTLLKSLAGLLEPATGSIKWSIDGADIQDPFEVLQASLHRSTFTDSLPSRFAMLLPQRPLAAPGSSLWQQMVYPSTERPPDAILHHLLDACGLYYLLKRTNNSFDNKKSATCWENTLSLGELQRLGFIRVLFNRPRIVLLDEPTASMDETTSSLLFSLLHKQNITCITVGQDTSQMKKLHSYMLQIEQSHPQKSNIRPEAGSWSFTKL